MKTTFYRIFIVIVAAVLLTSFSLHPANAETRKELQAAYIREGNLWLKDGNQEKRLTTDQSTSFPLWSTDGSRIAYLKNNSDAWVYIRETDSHFKLAEGASNLQWHPKQNVLAYQLNSILNVQDVRGQQPAAFKNAAFGVGNYSWMPDGKGFIVSTTAHLLPSGWTHPLLYKVYLKPDLSTRNVVRFFTIPKKIETKDGTNLAIGTSGFKWSPNGRWIAFIVYQTASLSADSNSLVVVSRDGRKFIPLGSMLNYPDWFHWSPSMNRIASVQGVGRESTHNKHLVVQVPPSNKTNELTPQGAVDTDFTWSWPGKLVVSRIFAQSGNDHPSLFLINNKNNQLKISEPPQGFGDYYPEFHPKAQKLTWVRANTQQSMVITSAPDGKNPQLWIAHIDSPSEYYGHRNWNEVLDVHDYIDFYY